MAHDMRAELGATAERRLQTAAHDVSQYLGTTITEREATAAYWNTLGVMDKQEFDALITILTKAEGYVTEADLHERLTRLKDRLTKRVLDLDQKLEEKQPEGLQKFNEWFSTLMKGKERGSRHALDTYKTKLDTLVKVYDTNRDTIIAQTGLLRDVDSYLSQSQQEVVKMIENYLTSGKISDVEEKAYFEQLKKVARDDPTGKTLARQILDTGNYLTALEATEELRKFSTMVEGTLTDLTKLQTAMDEGIALKNKIRQSGEQDLQLLQRKSEELYQLMEQKKQELEQDGHKIDYELFPKMKQVKDDILNGIGFLRGIVKGAGAGAGALFGLWLAGKIPDGTVRISRRELLQLRERAAQAPKLEEKL